MLIDNINLNSRTILVTGVAGFIGNSLTHRLLTDYPDTRVIGIDNMNSYYDVRIKEERLKGLSSFPGFIFIKGDIADKDCIKRAFTEYTPSVVVNLAAQAGVRYSITNPDAPECEEAAAAFEEWYFSGCWIFREGGGLNENPVM